MMDSWQRFLKSGCPWCGSRSLNTRAVLCSFKMYLLVIDREERKKLTENFIIKNSESDKDILDKEELRGGKRHHCALLTEGETLAL